MGLLVDLRRRMACERATRKTGGYCWRTQKCRNLCVPHAFFEGQKAKETSPRKSTPRTLKEVGQQYPGVFRADAARENPCGTRRQRTSPLSLGKTLRQMGLTPDRIRGSAHCILARPCAHGA